MRQQHWTGIFAEAFSQLNQHSSNSNCQAEGECKGHTTNFRGTWEQLSWAKRSSGKSGIGQHGWTQHFGGVFRWIYMQLQQVEIGSQTCGEAPRGSKIRIPNQLKSLLGFSGFWPRSLGLKAYKFMGSFSTPSSHSNFNKATIFWATQCRLVQQLGNLQLSHFPTQVWSCLSFETSPGAPFHHLLYLTSRNIIKWLKSSPFAAFIWVFAKYFVFVICYMDYLLVITCFAIQDHFTHIFLCFESCFLHLAQRPHFTQWGGFLLCIYA